MIETEQVRALFTEQRELAAKNAPLNPLQRKALETAVLGIVEQIETAEGVIAALQTALKEDGRPAPDEWVALAVEVVNALQARRREHENAQAVFQEEVGKRTEVEKQLDRARTQLGGVLSALEGNFAPGVDENSYGWSLAYKRALELHSRLKAADTKITELQRANAELEELATRGPLPEASNSRTPAEGN